jgi:hypothetical protein
MKDFAHSQVRRQVLSYNLRGCRSNPTKTRSTFDRFPIILRTGTGNLRTSVGTARI